MEVNVLQRRDLHCTTGTSNKVYQIVLLEGATPDKTRIIIAYGGADRARTGRFQSIEAQTMPLREAKNLLYEKVKDKLKKGYKEESPLPYTALDETKVVRTSELKDIAAPAKPLEVVTLDF